MSDLLVRMKLDQNGLDADLSEAFKKFNSFAKSAASIALPAAVVLGLEKAVDALADVGEHAIAAIAPLKDQAAALGVTAERLQELRAVSADAGVAASDLDSALLVLNKNLGNSALGKGDLGKVFKAAGLSLTDAQGNIKSVGVVWDELTKTISSGAVTQEQAVALSAAAFGRSGARMVEVLRQTTEEQQKVIDTARSFGAIISNDVVASADKYADQLELVKKGTEALGAQTDMVLAPLTIAWAKLKNEIGFAFAELAKGAGLIGDNLTLEQHELAQLEQKIRTFGDALRANGVDVALEPQMQALVKQWSDLKTKIKAAQDQAAQQEAATNSKSAGKVADDPFAHIGSDMAIDPKQWGGVRIEAMKSYTATMEQVNSDLQDELLRQDVTVGEKRVEAMRSFSEIFAQDAEMRKQMILDNTQTMLGNLENATGMLASTSKKMFELNKVLAISDAIVDTYRSVQKTLATYGATPWGIALAATAAALGAAHVAAIKKTQFGAGTTPSAAGTPTVNGQPVPQAQQVISVRGVDPNQMFSGRQLVDLINAAQKDGAKLVIGD